MARSTDASDRHKRQPIDDWESGEQWTAYPPTIPDEYYVSIGEICQRWAWLEFQCGVIAREILKLDKKSGYALMGGMALKPVANVLVALSLGHYLDIYPSLKQRVLELGENLSKLGDFRNEYAHGLWGYQSQQNTKLGLWKLRRPEDRASPKWVHKTMSEMRNAIQTLKSHQKNAQQLTWDLKNTLRKKKSLSSHGKRQ